MAGFFALPLVGATAFGFRAYLALLKLRLVAALVFVAVTMSIVAGHGQMVPDKLILLILAGGLASAGAACFNHYLDRDLDLLMERTRRRPIPSGRIRNPHSAALLGGVLFGLSTLSGAFLGWLALVFIIAGAAFYVVVYTWWLKRRNPLNVVVGGFAGSCAVIAGWLAIDDRLTLTPILVGLIVFSWTPAHFWSLAIALKHDYFRARIPMLPVLIGARRTARIVLLNTVITFVVSLLPAVFGLMGLSYSIAALLAGLLALRGSIRLLLAPSKEAAWRNYKLSGMYLGLLCVGMLVDSLLRAS